MHHRAGPFRGPKNACLRTCAGPDWNGTRVISTIEVEKTVLSIEQDRESGDRTGRMYRCVPVVPLLPARLKVLSG